MRRVVGLEALTEPLARSAVTIGKFFAVHRGHQALLRATVEAARQADALAVVLTFDRHPAEVLRPGTRLPVFASLEERLDLIAAEGADVTVVAHVDADFLAQEPEDFVRAVLVDRLSTVELLASDNFRFGRRARGDMQLLAALGAEHGFRCTSIPPVLEGGERISSSRIAACVEAGRVAEAAQLLGRPYHVPGTVVRGDQVGRQLGFPTANVATPEGRLLPADGVYLARVRDCRSSDPVGSPALVNLGVRPTRGGRERLLEAHLLDYAGDLYDHPVHVLFLDRLRDEQRFPDLDALKAQIGRDVDEARTRFLP